MGRGGPPPRQIRPGATVTRAGRRRTGRRAGQQRAAVARAGRGRGCTGSDRGPPPRGLGGGRRAPPHRGRSAAAGSGRGPLLRVEAGANGPRRAEDKGERGHVGRGRRRAGEESSAPRVHGGRDRVTSHRTGGRRGRRRRGGWGVGGARAR